MGRLQQCVYRVEPTPFPRDFPDRLDQLRSAAGLSWRGLARRLRLNVRSLQRWRRGARPDAAHLFALFVLAAELGLLHVLLPQAEPQGSSPAEQQDVVTRYDTDGDGKISLAEYNAAIPDLGATLTVSDLIKLRAAYLASTR